MQWSCQLSNFNLFEIIISFIKFGIILKAYKFEKLQHVRHDVGLQQRVQESRLLNFHFDQPKNLQPQHWRILFRLGLEGSGFVGPSQRSWVQRIK